MILSPAVHICRRFFDRTGYLPFTLAVVVVDGRANEFCFLQRDQRQLAQHLARQLRALVGVVVVPPFS